MTKRSFTYFVLLIGIFFGVQGPSSFAQLENNDFIPASRELASEEGGKLKEGWNHQLKIGSNLNFNSNSNVIGQVDGDTTTWGYTLDGAASLKSGQSEWRNTLSSLVNVNKNPTISSWTKSNDETQLKSLYSYSLKEIPWLGPYAKASVATSLFFSEDVRSDSTTYVINHTNGTSQNHVGESLRLTDGFRPLTTKESAGFFARLYDTEQHKGEFRLGVGALQVKADNQLAIDDDSATANTIEVKELKSFEQVGVELEADFQGRIDKVTTYSFVAEALVPVGEDVKAGEECGDCSDFELTNYELASKITSKIYDWANISYEYKLKKQPQILNKVQTQHFVLLNFAYDLLK